MKLKEIGKVRYNYVDIIFSDKKGWRHNSDGPAHIASTGYKSWWVHGTYIRNGNET